MKIKLKRKPKPKSTPELPLQSLRLHHFKAVRESEVEFTPLTVFIGNNGSGKSSLIEALETFRNIVLEGLDDALIPWKGFESVWNKAVSHQEVEDKAGQKSLANPMEFRVTGKINLMERFIGTVEINKDKERDQIFITNQDFDARVAKFRDLSNEPPTDFRIRDIVWREFVRRWQFLNLEPSRMLEPKPQRRSSRGNRLQKDGSNIAQYLQSILDAEPEVLEGIVDTLKSVLPYASDFRPAITSELERNVYLKLTERGIEEPLSGWLLSQGTLRIIALLAVFRHPKPPSVVFIEELENGLDPRTIHLLIEEIRSFLQSGGQVVATSHSPYLLDLLDLSQIVVVERNKSGAPEFKRPSKQKLKGWAEKFAPGRLYTMGNLTEN